MADRRLASGKTGVKPGENHPQNREQYRGKTGVKPGATCTPHTPQCFRTRLKARAAHLDEPKYAFVGRSEQTRLRCRVSAVARGDLPGAPPRISVAITKPIRGLSPGAAMRSRPTHPCGWIASREQPLAQRAADLRRPDPARCAATAGMTPLVTVKPCRPLHPFPRASSPPRLAAAPLRGTVGASHVHH